MIPDLEAVLRGVPCRLCGVLHGGGRGCAKGAVAYHSFAPDFPAMAQAVRKAVAEQDKALRYSARERVRLGEERDALRADLAQARAEGERLQEALEIAPDDVGRIMHEAWTRTKLSQGFHRPPLGEHPRELPCAKCHADLIPWEDLPEHQKDINRHAFDDVLREIRKRAALAPPLPCLGP